MRTTPERPVIGEVLMRAHTNFPGHSGDAIVARTESGRRFRAVCDCGYGAPRWPGDTPRTYATQQVAEQALIKHLRWVRERLDRDLAYGGGSPSTTPSHPPVKL